MPLYFRASDGTFAGQINSITVSRAVARSLALFIEKVRARRQAQKAGDYFWPQSIPNLSPSPACRSSAGFGKAPVYDGNVCDCRYRSRSRWFSAISARENPRVYLTDYHDRGALVDSHGDACARLFGVPFFPLSPSFFLFFFYSFLVFAQTGYPRYFSARSFVTRNDRFFVLLCPVVFHCPYLLSLFLPDAAAAPPRFSCF